MSLITRCPACETMFKVVPDQLRISEGWVRCGQCAEIFNATQNMVASDSPAVSVPGATSFPAPLESGTTPASTQALRDDAPAPAGPPPATTVTPVAPTPAETFWQPPVDSGLEAGTAPPPLPTEPPGHDLPGREPAWQAQPQTEATPAPMDTPARPAPESESDDREHDDTPALSFLRDEARQGFWQNKGVRWVLLVLALVLAIVLAVQVVLQERNRIAQLAPGSRGLLLGVCALARCELGALQQIESVVIDGSSFGRVRGDNYRLGFSLRNTAPIDVAMPAIELSLTDTQDQALVRRVILPGEFGAPAAALAAGADWSTSLALAVRTAGNTERISGYRLLAFYP